MNGKRYELPITHRTFSKMELREDGRGALNMSNGFILKGKCDFERLDKAVRRLYARYDAMRTNIKEEEKGAYFEIFPVSPLGLGIVELSAVKRDARFEEAIADAQKRVREPLSLSDEGMYRFWAYKISEDETLVIYVVNHLVTDGGSMAIINMELEKLYENPERMDLLECTDYADFLKEKQWLWGEGLIQEEVDYWKNLLDGYENPPIEAPKVVEEKSPMEYGRFSIDLTKVSKIARKSRMSNFNVVSVIVQMAYAIVTKQKDMVMRYVMSNRFTEEYRRTVGFITQAFTARHTFLMDEEWSDLAKWQRDTMNRDMKHMQFSDMIEMQELFISYVVSNGDSTSAVGKFGELEMQPFVLHSNCEYGRRMLGLVVVEYTDKIYITPYCDNKLYSKELVLKFGTAVNKCVERIYELENPTVEEIFE